MNAGWPRRSDEPKPGPGLRAAPQGAGVPLGPLDPTIIHRARAINTDALRVIDDLLDQIADRGRS